MKKVRPIKKEEADAVVKRVFNTVERDYGRVSNLHATMGHSPNALSGYLDFTRDIESGEFNQLEIEAIKLAVSQENDCEYCIAAHTAMAMQAGYTEEETMDIRSGEIEDVRLNALVMLTREMVDTKGKPDQEFVDRFFAVGYSEKALVELVMLVGAKVISNYLNHITDIEVDWPTVKELNAELSVE